MDLLEQIKLFPALWDYNPLLGNDRTIAEVASLSLGTKKTLPSPRIREDVGKRSVHIAAKGLGPLTERI